MSNASMHLSLPYIQGGQAQKHVTHNEALRTLDTVVHLSVLARADSPGAVVEEGHRYVITGAPSGDWAGHAGSIAHREQGAWQFTVPQTGWIAWDQNAGVQIVFNGTDWAEISSGGGSTSSAPQFGINASADTTNRLAVSSDAVLFSHAGSDHQIKVNKAAAGDTASLLFQTNWTGHAEMGLAGNDDFEIKVSPDGSTFHSALSVDHESGAVSFPNTEFSDPAFGASSLLTQDYAISRVGGLVTNGTGYLGNGFNYPESFVFDAGQTPNLPAAFACSGYFAGAEEMEEFIAVDPNRLYRVSSYLRQEGLAGDWSSYAQAERHAHYLGFACYDTDGFAITASHHGRYRHNGVDSLTTLSQPLSPGDNAVHVVDASGWNETIASDQHRGVVIFEYKNAHGHRYANYSRIEDADLFDLGDVDKAIGTITLNKPFPAHLANPDDAGGVWPVGTKIANRTTGFHYKFGFIEDLVLPNTDTWYRISNAIGGIDTSGRNIPNNFAPGTVSVRPVALMNYTNRAGGYSGYPDTGAGHRVWLTGLSVEVDHSGVITKDLDGACDLHILEADTANGTVTCVLAAPQVVSIGGQ